MTESERIQLQSVAAGTDPLPELRATTSNWPLERFNYAKGLALRTNPAAAVKLIILRAERLESLRLRDLEELTWRRRIAVVVASAIIVGFLAWFAF
jgi:hypothetical protein